ncbi:MAG TPA: hypothetical protein VG101_20485 [Puia sp.]|jgi:hypothetical protein|nr:hypothetical protein [Puia sp.]
MLLFTSHITPRLKYIVEFFSNELFDDSAAIRITNDRTTFVAATGPRINYSAEELPGSFRLRPHPLIFDANIQPIPITVITHNDQKTFFPTDGNLPFDIFAASFYLLSRYEEYLPHPKDEYGRFAHTYSLAWKEGFLDRPLINDWIQALRKELSQLYPDLVFHNQAFKFIPTYDIDTAYSYRFKGWRRNLGGILKSLAAGKWESIINRVAVLRGREQDPFDVYEWLDSLHLYCRLRPYYFFLAAARQEGVDRNLPITAPGFMELIRYHAAGSRIGVHPSWQSGDQDDLMKEEIDWMEYISGQQITRSRQHYIRFALPVTYRRLLQHGIDQDYSMGYGSVNGFRASVASSFYWYDLEKEEKTALRLFPFCYMDANSFYEQRSTAAAAMTELMGYYRSIRKINGLMVTIWHNSILGQDPEFIGWREVYETFLKQEIFWDM